MNRNRAAFQVAAGILVANTGIGALANEVAQPPNVLFIVIDDLKPWIGSFSHPVVQTPHIDRLAERGTVFLNNFSQVALCGPSRLSALTGLRPDTLQVYNHGVGRYQISESRRRAPHLETIPGFFLRHGYETIGFGKIFDGRNTGPGQDRDSWSGPGGVQWEWDDSLWPERPARGGYQCPDTRARIDAALQKAEERGITGREAMARFLAGIEGTRPAWENLDVPDEAYNEGNVMAAPAIRTIHKRAPRYREGGEPFFLAVGFYKPHLPFVAPKRYWDLYDTADFELEPVQVYPENGVPFAETPYIEGRSYHYVPDEGPIPEEVQRNLLHGYAACVSYVDAQIGKLLDALEAEALCDHTIIVLWGDHGFHLGDKEIWGKHTVFEQANIAPLLIAAPSIPGGRVEDVHFTELTDIFPTLCELAELPPPQGLEGRSLAGLMRGEPEPTPGVSLSQYARMIDGVPIMGWSIRAPRYRYAEWREMRVVGMDHEFGSELLGIELYDYEADPHERRNRARDPEYQDVLKKLMSQFDDTLSYLPPRQLTDKTLP